MKNSNKGKRKILVTTIVAIMLAITISILPVFGWLSNVERILEDRMYQTDVNLKETIKIIAIDEASLLAMGPFDEWDRSYFAKIIEIVNGDATNRPKVLGMDIVFCGSNGTENDRLLVDVVKKYDNIVLASELSRDEINESKEGNCYIDLKYVIEGAPFEELSRVTDYGFINVHFDEDGYVRRAHTYVTAIDGDKKSNEYSFAYKIASKVSGINYLDSIVAFQYAGKPGYIETVSFVDVFQNKIDPSYFKDSIVLIGVYEDGMMESYKVPIDYSKEMYGVEVQANIIHALVGENIVYSMGVYGEFILAFVILVLYAVFALNKGIKKSLAVMIGAVIGYMILILQVYHMTHLKMNILTVPMGIVEIFVVSVVYKYIKMQRNSIKEMRDILFSMSEAMAEAIEGRTPYNANHTKNVARRCVEMLDYINAQYKKKRTRLHFSKNDKQQIYLAAMLHDVGKMDVPIEVMDKPTKLGSREKELRTRLEMIMLYISNDSLSGRIPVEEAKKEIAFIEEFISKLDGFNCGRPLKEDEWNIINTMADKNYHIEATNETIPYLTDEEIEDLQIKAGTLSDSERVIMQSHAIYTDKILAHMKFGEQFDKVRNVASNHHELLNGKGYPCGKGEEEIDNLTRVLTIMDIYDSLIADDRPYKKPKTIEVAFEILDEEANAGKIDKEILGFAKELYMK